MEKYSNDIVNAYMKCERIDGYSVDELENDPEFMKLVITETGDKKIYFMCSDKVREDEQFVKSALKKFANDSYFVNTVTQEYMDYLDTLDSEKNNITLLKASFANDMMEINNAIGANSEKYSSILSFMYNNIRIKAEAAKKNKEEENLGLGFKYFKSLFGEDEKVLSHFASIMVDEILGESLDKFEKLLHADFEKFEYVSDLYGDLLNHIDEYDKDLVDYLNDHMEALLKGSEKSINSIKNNWDSHNLHAERVKYNKMLDFVHEIVISNYDAIFSEEALLVHMGYKYGIIDKIAKYAVMGDNMIQLLREDFNDVYFDNIKEFSSADRDMYNQVDGVFKKILK